MSSAMVLARDLTRSTYRVAGAPVCERHAQAKQATPEVSDSLCSRTNFPCSSCVKGPRRCERPRGIPNTERHQNNKTSGKPRVRVAGRRRLDTEAGMLSGISRKCSLRSELHWFTEFCRSQCLSQFAASFIVVRAETSIAESCKKKSRSRQLQLRFDDAKDKGRERKRVTTETAKRSRVTRHHLSTLPCRPWASEQEH